MHGLCSNVQLMINPEGHPGNPVEPSGFSINNSKAPKRRPQNDRSGFGLRCESFNILEVLTILHLTDI